MSEILAVFNPQFGAIQYIDVEGKPYFVGKDVAQALGYTNPRDALKRHCRGVAKHDTIDRLGRKQEINIIPEGDLYRLIIHSQLPAAEKFERWVFDEVLPSIRQTGRYSIMQSIPVPLDYNGRRVITTEILAKAYKVEMAAIRHNYNSRKALYTEGEHFYCLTGKELLNFKKHTTNALAVDPRGGILYVWTEKGAFLHARTIGTDEVLEAYEQLIGTYFQSQVAALAGMGLSPDMRLIKQLFANIVALEERLKLLESPPPQPPPEPLQPPPESPQLARLIELLERQQSPTQAISEPTERRLMTRREAAEYLGITESMIAGLSRKEEFPALVRIGGRRVFIDRRKLDQWIAAQSK